VNTALLVIDYINGILEGSCKDYTEKHPILEKTNRLIKGCRNQEIPIYFIRLGFDEN